MELTQRELSVAAPLLQAMSREPSSSFRGDGRREGSRWTRAEAQGPTEAGGGGRRGDGWAGFVILPGIVPQGCAGPSSGLRGRLVGTFGGVSMDSSPLSEIRTRAEGKWPNEIVVPDKPRDGSAVSLELLSACFKQFDR